MDPYMVSWVACFEVSLKVIDFSFFILEMQSKSPMILQGPSDRLAEARVPKLIENDNINTVA